MTDVTKSVSQLEAEVERLRSALEREAARFASLARELVDTAESVKRQRDENRKLIAQLAERRDPDTAKLQREVEKLRSALRRSVHRGELAEERVRVLCERIEEAFPGTSVMYAGADFMPFICK